jgi:hypothetical protein
VDQFSAYVSAASSLEPLGAGGYSVALVTRGDGEKHALYLNDAILRRLQLEPSFAYGQTFMGSKGWDPAAVAFIERGVPYLLPRPAAADGRVRIRARVASAVRVLEVRPLAEGDPLESSLRAAAGCRPEADATRRF